MFDRETRREKNLVKLAKSVAKRAKREAADAAAAAKKSSSSQSTAMEKKLLDIEGKFADLVSQPAAEAAQAKAGKAGGGARA